MRNICGIQVHANTLSRKSNFCSKIFKHINIEAFKTLERHSLWYSIKLDLKYNGIPVCMRRNHGFGIWNYVTEQFDESSSGLFFFFFLLASLKNVLVWIKRMQIKPTFLTSCVKDADKEGVRYTCISRKDWLEMLRVCCVVRRQGR